MKSRLFVVTENRDEDINITLNGGVILFPTPHGNWNMHFPMMAKYWLTTKNTTTFNFSLSPSRHMFPIEFLDDIRLVLETEKDLTPIIQ